MCLEGQAAGLPAGSAALHTARESLSEVTGSGRTLMVPSLRRTIPCLGPKEVGRRDYPVSLQRWV